MDTIAPGKTTEAPRRRRTRRTPVLVAVAIVVAIALILVADRPRHRPAASAKPDATIQTVTVARAARHDIPVTLAELGTVTPITTVTIKSQISGYLTEIAFHEGQDVRRGDFLAQVDPRPYQAVLEQYEGNLLRDQAMLRDAQLNLYRYQHLVKLDSIAQQNLDAQEATVAQYEGAVKTDQGQIDAEKLDLIYAHITAPSDGRLGLRQVDNGNYVTPGDTNGIVVLTQLRPISIIFTVPQTALGPVLERMRQAPLGVTALASDDTTVLAEGTVGTIDNQIDTTTGTVKLRAIFPNTDESLFPNQFVNVSLLVDTRHDVITVPNEAVQHGTPGTYVFLVQPDHTVTLRTISAGASANGLTEVASGLAPGDTVVVEGTSRLREGSKVSVVESP
jgi:multidrug efflux system membrane fusion protein